ncbi:glycosyltransferase family 4 protein [Flavobacterium nackdongense]|uniref:Glycosyltransferase n=1 Tax=Flavobacterium nackdongense TaxID=2547394 RepID=A0A4P6Y750_9FLAO|nr:glycosyltransferase family 4 protein [Flavobacterium nackdongense]QBN18389.1 glycosyltransferase [Flavobacterium nackdongense]
MRIIQIIDSLEAGGAERMAVNYANALAHKIDFSGLVATRKEGALINQLDSDVSYLFLNKKSAFDLKSLGQLRQFVKKNKVEIIHAHSTSFFTAFLLKLSCPKTKLIWHDHYGDSEFLAKRSSFGLQLVLPFFNGIIAVNQQLKNWAEQQLHFKNVIYLPNFPAADNRIAAKTILDGMPGKRIVCLANLRVQKDHFLLLEVAKKMQKSHPDWTFHLVGKDFEDDYSKKIRAKILDYNLQKTVYCYGSRNDISAILEQSEIGILTSQSEGLPVALLEYGWHSKPVVVTSVGEIPLVIQNGINGFLVETGSVELFFDALVKLMEKESLRADLGKALQQTIVSTYSEKAVLLEYSNWIAKMMK